jgi:hypothetical protein
MKKTILFLCALLISDLSFAKVLLVYKTRSDAPFVMSTVDRISLSQRDVYLHTSEGAVLFDLQSLSGANPKVLSSNLDNVQYTSSMPWASLIPDEFIDYVVYCPVVQCISGADARPLWEKVSITNKMQAFDQYKKLATSMGYIEEFFSPGQFRKTGF